MRWLRYREAFGAGLVHHALPLADGPVLDPFAGACTAPIAAAAAGRDATGIEIMPVGVRLARAVEAVAAGFNAERISDAATRLLHSVRDPAAPHDPFPHVAITAHAFSETSEAQIGRARAHVARTPPGAERDVLDIACMSALEPASWTRKDGQFLRWDRRSGRDVSPVDLGPVPPFAVAIESALGRIVQDAPALAWSEGAAPPPRIIEGSALRLLPDLPDESVGLVVTSPPYANRYDYTRTYALELAWCGLDRDGFGALRQRLLSATVENNSKAAALRASHPRPALIVAAAADHEAAEALAEALAELESRRDGLSHPRVIDLVNHYCFEMAVVIRELARLLRPGGAVVMVNDNVQYGGVPVPLDLILSDFAERAGLDCEEIGVLPQRKGNASQQMGAFGRTPLRKCVYVWRKPA